MHLSGKRLKAFTLLESLLVLFLVSTMLISLSGQVHAIFSKVRQELFFLEFEHLYKESQQLSQYKGQEVVLSLTATNISNGVQEISLPPDVTGPQMEVRFDRSGGNHSLSKLVFQTPEKQVSYQLYLGSGKYQKTED